MLVQRLEREKISFFFPTCSTLELCGSFWTPQVPHFWFCTRKLAFFWFRDSLQLSPIIFRLGDIKIPPKDWKRGPPEPAWPVLMRVKERPGSVPGKERLCRSLRVPRKERQSRSCHGTGKIKNYYYFFSQEGGEYFRMVPTLVSAHVRKLWVPLPLIHLTVRSYLVLFVLWYAQGMTSTLLMKFANMFEKWFFF